MVLRIEKLDNNILPNRYFQLLAAEYIVRMNLSISWSVLFILLYSFMELSLGCPFLSRNTCIGSSSDSYSLIRRREFVRMRTQIAKNMSLPLRLNVTIGMEVASVFKKYETKKDSPASVHDTNKEQNRQSNQKQTLCDRAMDPKVKDKVYNIRLPASYGSGGSSIPCQCEPLTHEIATLEFKDCTPDYKEEKWVLTAKPVTVGFVCVKRVP